MEHNEFAAASESVSATQEEVWCMIEIKEPDFKEFPPLTKGDREELDITFNIILCYIHVFIGDQTQDKKEREIMVFLAMAIQELVKDQVSLMCGKPSKMPSFKVLHSAVEKFCKESLNFLKQELYLFQKTRTIDRLQKIVNQFNYISTIKCLI